MCRGGQTGRVHGVGRSVLIRRPNPSSAEHYVRQQDSLSLPPLCVRHGEILRNAPTLACRLRKHKSHVIGAVRNVPGPPICSHTENRPRWAHAGMRAPAASIQ